MLKRPYVPNIEPFGLVRAHPHSDSSMSQLPIRISFQWCAGHFIKGIRYVMSTEVVVHISFSDECAPKPISTASSRAHVLDMWPEANSLIISFFYPYQQQKWGGS